MFGAFVGMNNKL